MADPKIKLKRSAVAGKIPTPDQLPLGEVALNTFDGYLYASKNVGVGTTVIALNPFRVGTGTDTYNAYFTAGDVGIGTTNPKAKLEINVGSATTALDIQGSAGQLFSVTNNLTSGSIFSVNDVSGIPSIDVNADGTIQLAPFGSTEYVGIGTTNPSSKLDVTGHVNVSGVVTATSFSGSGSNLTGLTGASAATYGNANATPVIVVDSDGRITGISTVATAGSGSASGNVVDDTSPQLGGDLDLNSNDITGTGNVNITGVVTATSFVGNVTGTASSASVANQVFTQRNETNANFYFTFVDDVSVTPTANTLYSDTALNLNPYTNIVSGGGMDMVAYFINSVEITSTATELNILDGATLSTSELNILDGVTATTSELNVLDGITATTSELNLTGDLGTFTGSTISDNATVKAALQELETSLESVSGGGAQSASVAVGATNTNASHYITFVDSNNTSPTQELIETDGALSYNPSTNILTVGGSGHIEANVVGDIIGDVTGTADVATNVSVTNISSTNTDFTLVMSDGSNTSTGRALGMDSGLTYNPSTNVLTAGTLVGNVTGNADTADQVKTQTTTTSSNHYLTFVDSNNGSATAETVYTDASLHYNPVTNQFTAPGVNLTILSLDGVDVTSTAAELNILDGVTATTSELNILDGVTATTSEINVLDGATAGSAVASKALVVDSNRDIDNLRRVGIGTDSPTQSLEVSGSKAWFKPNETGADATALSLGRFNNTNGSFYDIDVNDATGDNVVQRINRYTGTWRFNRSSPDGEKNTIVFDTNYQNGNNVGIYNTAATHYRVRFQGEDDCYFNNVGNVGIKSTAPSVELDVNGAFSVSGVSTFSSDVSFGSTATFGDNSRLKFGDGEDLQIYHSGSNSIISDTGSGHLDLRTNGGSIRIRTTGTEDMAIFNKDGSVELYYDNTKKFETTADGIKVRPHVGLGTTAGSFQDLAIFETANANGSKLRIVEERDTAGTDWTTAYTRIQKTVDVTDQAYIQFNGDGNNYGMEFGNAANGEKFAEFKQNSSVDLYHNGNKKFETASGGVTVTGTVTADGLSLGDSEYAYFGADNDLQIYHTGSISYISDQGTGALRLLSNQFRIRNADNNEQIANFTQNGSVELYYDNSLKFETTGAGATVYGTTQTQQLNVSGVSTFASDVSFSDDVKALFGDGSDLEIYHDGGNASYIRDVGTGNLNIDSTGGNIQIRVNTNESAIVAKQDGAVDLYYDNSKKLATTSGGVTVTGTVTADGLSLGDTEYANFGADDDLQIGHVGGSFNNIQGSAELRLQSASQIQLKEHGTSEVFANFIADGAVELFHDAVKKFETTGIGVSVVGVGSTATITGPANLVIDPGTVGDNTGTVYILGDLQVDGTQTVINSTTVSVDDLNLTLASGAANASAANGAGITVDGASATLTYASSGDKWVFNKAPYYNSDRLLTTADEGSGNGIDADTVDGIEASSFLRSNAADTATGDLTIEADLIVNTNTNSRYLYISRDGSTSNQFTKIGRDDLITYFHTKNDEETSTVRFRFENTDTESGGGASANDRNIDLISDATDARITIAGNRVLTTADEGTGNGIDADTVDGIEAASFLRSDAADTASGSITFSGGQTWNSNITWNNGRNIYVDGESSFDVRTGGQWHVWDQSTADNWITATNGQPLYLNNNALTTIVNTSSSSDYFQIRNRSDTDVNMLFYCESQTAQIADTFTDTTTDKKYIYFNNPNSSNDPGFIMHETSNGSGELNEGVLHLVPSDDNATNDYVSIHGTNDADQLRLHTSGLVESVAGQLELKSGSGGIYLNDDVGIGTNSPGVKLDVRGDTKILGGSLTVSNSETVADYGHIKHNDNYHAIILRGFSSDTSGTPSATNQMSFVEYGGIFNFYKTNGTDNNNFVRFREDNDSWINTSGFVGIGTDNPSSKLNVYSTDLTKVVIEGDGSSTSASSLVIQSNDTGSSFRGHGVFYYDAQADIEWFSGRPYNGNDAFSVHRKASVTSPGDNTANRSNSLFLINSDGEVGIGTIDPQADLHIESSGPGIRLSDTGNARAFAYLDANAANAIIHADKGNTVSDSRIGFAVDNDEKARISSDGNLGIGNDNPAVALDLGKTKSTNQIKLKASDGNVDLRINPAFGSADVASMTVVGAYPLTFHTNNTERIRIESGGDVGIGTTNPSHRLHVYGSEVAAFGPGTTNGNTLLIGADIPTSTDADTAQIELTNGNLHIDTTEGNYGVYLNYFGGQGGTVFGNGNSGSVGKFSNSGVLTINTTSVTGTASQNLQVSGGAYVSGSVGIGVTLPVGLTAGSSNTLHLNGNSAVMRVGPYYTSGGDRDNILLVANSQNTYIRSNNERFSFYNSTGDIVFHGDSDAEKVRITGIGSVGIGLTNPSEKLHVSGKVKIDNGDAADALDLSNGNLIGVNHIKINDPGPNEGISWNGGNGWSIYESPNDLTTNSAGNLQFVDSGSRILTLDTSGNAEFTGSVGIGTINPSQKLNVYNSTPSDTGGVLVQNVSYSNNQDKPYLVVGTKAWTGATTNWNTYGFQHRVKSNSGGTPRITVDTSTGEKFCIENGGDVGIGTNDPSTKLDVRGHIKVDDGPTLENGSSNALRVTTDSGYIDFGPQNSSFAHIKTNLAKFYFNKKLVVDEGIISSYDEDLIFQTDNTTEERVRILSSNGNTGIGTNNPNTKLDVAGDISIRNGAQLNAIRTNSAGQLQFLRNAASNNQVTVTIDDETGDVGIGTTVPGYKLHVNGSFAATTKSFVIDHPTKDGMKLRYGSLEGPENGVYVRGRLKGNDTIELPEHWTGLVDEETITVNLTPIGRKAPLHSVVDIAENTVIVESANDAIDCFYTVFGERKDVEKLEVEF